MSETQPTFDKEPYRLSREGEDWFWVLCTRETPQDNGRIQRIYYFQRVEKGQDIPEDLNAVSLPDKFEVDTNRGTPRLIKKEVTD